MKIDKERIVGGVIYCWQESERSRISSKIIMFTLLGEFSKKVFRLEALNVVKVKS